jgi:hypothetical protein
MTGVMLNMQLLPTVNNLAYVQYIPSSGQTGLDIIWKLQKKYSEWPTGINIRVLEPHVSVRWSNRRTCVIHRRVWKNYYLIFCQRVSRENVLQWEESAKQILFICILCLKPHTRTNPLLIFPRAGTIFHRCSNVKRKESILHFSFAISYHTN